MWTSACFDGPDAFRRQGVVAGEEFGVFSLIYSHPSLLIFVYSGNKSSGWFDIYLGLVSWRAVSWVVSLEEERDREDGFGFEFKNWRKQKEHWKFPGDHIGGGREDWPMPVGIDID